MENGGTGTSAVTGSPSSRRAWVEIRLISHTPHCLLVALLAEGVGRNYLNEKAAFGVPESPSSRRAWVEIRGLKARPGRKEVALLAEGVGRNFVRHF